MTVQGHPPEVEGSFDTDLDHHSPHFRENNYAILGELREGCPVAHSSTRGGRRLRSATSARTVRSRSPRYRNATVTEDDGPLAKVLAQAGLSAIEVADPCHNGLN